jgi:hypothetical protein
MYCIARGQPRLINGFRLAFSLQRSYNRAMSTVQDLRNDLEGTRGAWKERRKVLAVWARRCLDESGTGCPAEAAALVGQEFLKLRLEEAAHRLRKYRTQTSPVFLGTAVIVATAVVFAVILTSEAGDKALWLTVFLALMGWFFLAWMPGARKGAARAQEAARDMEAVLSSQGHELLWPDTVARLKALDEDLAQGLARANFRLPRGNRGLEVLESFARPGG